MTISTTNEFEEATLGEGSNGVVGKPTTKDMISNGLKENIPKL